MPAPQNSPDNGFLNDLLRQPPAESETRRSSEGAGWEGAQTAQAPRAKRIACILCRKRKLKCDGLRPSCGTCKRLAHDCAYDEVRKKSGPKRGYVKALEARLQQVETLLKTQESAEPNPNAQGTANAFTTDAPAQAPSSTEFQHASMAMDGIFEFSQAGAGVPPSKLPSMQPTGSMDTSSGSDTFSWEMIGLGLDEPLPNQDVINELTQIYFERVHSTAPMIHRPRFLAAMNLAPHMRPPICLRYSMWTLAAAATEKYEALQEHFYQRARKYAQMDEMKGHGESTVTLAHCQAWVLISTYEFKAMYFPRAWLSTGRAVRLSQMMSLHKLDGTGLEVKQCLHPPKDWTEKEERRRTFWLCFNIDRYASIGTAWPMTFDEQDILTHLPAADEAFDQSKTMSTMSLEQALTPMGAAHISPFGGVCVMACLFGRNLTHLHRPTNDEREDDLNGEFWQRHRRMDAVLLNIALALRDDMRFPAGISNPNVVFMNMKLHTSVVCLHQAAIFKAEKSRLPSHILQECKIRCISAASEIANIMRRISHMDMGAMHPCMAFCIYVAARVFVQHLRNRPGDGQMNSHLQFLHQAMHALKRRNPLTESFLVQLDLDLESTGILTGTGSKPRGYEFSKAHSKFECNPGESSSCIAILEDPGSTSAKASTFGESDLTSHAAPSQHQSKPTPGPPFRVAESINLDTDPSPFSFTASDGGSFELPSRQKTPGAPTPREMHAGRASFVEGLIRVGKDASDMDTSPDASGEHTSPSNSGHSQHGASSRSSYSTPPDMQNTAQGYGGITTGQPSSNSGGMRGSAAGSNFAYVQHPTTGDEFEHLFYNPTSGVSEWDMNGGTGLTPLPDSAWTQMFDATGWAGFGAGHGTDMFGKPAK